MITPHTPQEEVPSPGDPSSDARPPSDARPASDRHVRSPTEVPETILVALDGSPFGETALAHARVLARAFGSRLHLVTVFDPSRSGGTVAVSAECRLQMAEAKNYLERLARSLEDDRLAADLETREGNPAHEIVAAAREREAGLVVLAARPRRRDERLVSRGVAQGVIAAGVGSLLVARGEPMCRGRDRADAMYRRIAVAVDGSSASHRALRVAASLARSEGARLVLVHVFPPGTGTSEGRAASRSQGGESGVGTDAPRSDGAYLRELASRLDGPGTGVDTVLCRSSRVADTVEEVAREVGVDLLVLGARGAGRASSRYGGCARWLLRHGQVPVLVVRGAEGKTTADGWKTGARGALRNRRPREHIRGGPRYGRGPRSGTPVRAAESGGVNEERSRR